MKYIKRFEAYIDWEIGDTLTCIDNRDVPGGEVRLTIGKEYVILDIDREVDNVKVLDDSNKKQFYMLDRFERKLDNDIKKFNV